MHSCGLCFCCLTLHLGFQGLGPRFYFQRVGEFKRAALAQCLRATTGSTAGRKRREGDPAKKSETSKNLLVLKGERESEYRYYDRAKNEDSIGSHSPALPFSLTCERSFATSAREFGRVTGSYPSNCQVIARASAKHRHKLDFLRSRCHHHMCLGHGIKGQETIVRQAAEGTTAFAALECEAGDILARPIYPPKPPKVQATCLYSLG